MAPPAAGRDCSLSEWLCEWPSLPSEVALWKPWSYRKDGEAKRRNSPRWTQPHHPLHELSMATAGVLHSHNRSRDTACMHNLPRPSIPTSREEALVANDVLCPWASPADAGCCTSTLRPCSDSARSRLIELKQYRLWLFQPWLREPPWGLKSGWKASEKACNADRQRASCCLPSTHHGGSAAVSLRLRHNSQTLLV